MKTENQLLGEWAELFLILVLTTTKTTSKSRLLTIEIRKSNLNKMKYFRTRVKNACNVEYLIRKRIMYRPLFVSITKYTKSGNRIDYYYIAVSYVESFELTLLTSNILFRIICVAMLHISFVLCRYFHICMNRKIE